MTTPARRFGQVAGSVYVAVGLLGFALTGLEGFASTRGASLWLLEVNPLHNSLHVLLGLSLVVAAARGEAQARTLAMLTGATYGVVGLLGLGVVGTGGNILALNTADNVVHLITAVAAVGAAAASTRLPRHRTSRV
jgi:hypothetical protein